MKDLDISWSGVRPSTMIRLIRFLKQSCGLQCLSLGYNRLLEDTTTVSATTNDLNQAFNNEVLECLEGIIVHSMSFTHFDLQGTGLTEAALRQIVSYLANY